MVGAAVFEHVSFVILARDLSAQHPDGCFVGLDISTGKERRFHRPGNRRAEFADLHDIAAQRGAMNAHARVFKEIDALPVKRIVVPVFLERHVDNEGIGQFAFFHDPSRGRRAQHAGFGTALAGPLLALDHANKIFGRLHVKDFGLVVANQMGVASALTTAALVRRAADDFINPLQMLGQFYATGTGVAFLATQFLLLFDLVLNLLLMHARLLIKKLKLGVAELLALGTKFGDPQKTNHLYLQLENLLQLLDLRGLLTGQIAQRFNVVGKGDYRRDDTTFSVCL